MMTIYALADEVSIAKDAQAIGRKADAVNVLLENHSLHEALDLLTPDRTPLVGDILYRSWGYDQTNINFYRVIAVTAKSVKIIPLKSRRDHSDTYNDYVVPGEAQDSYDFNDAPFKGKPATKRFECTRDERDGYRSYRCNFNSYSTLRLWDGTPLRQTGAMYGH